MYITWFIEGKKKFNEQNMKKYFKSLDLLIGVFNIKGIINDLY